MLIIRPPEMLSSFPTLLLSRKRPCLFPAAEGKMPAPFFTPATVPPNANIYVNLTLIFPPFIFWIS